MSRSTHVWPSIQSLRGFCGEISSCCPNALEFNSASCSKCRGHLKHTPTPDGNMHTLDHPLVHVLHVAAIACVHRHSQFFNMVRAAFRLLDGLSANALPY